MIEAVLFDLDDTLLSNPMTRFLARYFALLGQYVGRQMDRRLFQEALLTSTQAMIANTNPSILNKDTFWASFQAQTGKIRGDFEPFIAAFYRDEFSRLQPETQRRPAAAALVRACFDMGLKVVIATNPVFPQQAIEQRLAWAGVPVDEYPFSLVTTYDNMHACKPHAAYYQEILTRIACQPEAALMVGDDWRNDITPAASLGLYTYWIATDEATLPDAAVSVSGRGTLDELYHLVKSGWLQQLCPVGETGEV